MKLLCPAHPVQIKEFLAYNSVLVEDFVELAELKEKNLLIVGRLYLPVLRHGGSKLFPLFSWDVKARRIVVRMVRSAALDVPQIILL